MTTPGAPGGAAEQPVAAVVTIDSGGSVTGWTRAAEDLLGHRAGDVPCRGPLLMPDDPAGASAWRERFGGREHWSGLFEVRRRDGERILLHADGSRLRPRREPASWLVVMTPACAGGTHSVLDPLVSHTPIAMAIWDRDLRCIWLNEAARRLRRVFPHFEVGRLMTDPIPGVDTRTSQEALRKVLFDGVPQIDREARWQSPDGREERTLSTTLFRLDGADGRPLGAASMVLDIGGSQARNRLALLREASIRIGTTLDVWRTAQEMADLAVPELADYVTVDLAESVLPETEPLERLPATEVSIPVFRRAGAASIHDGTPESLWPQGQAVFVPPSSPFTMVLSSGRSHFEPVLDTSSGTWLDQDPDRARLIHDLGMHTLIIVPLRARGDILGVTVFVRTDNRTPFSRDDLLLAEELAARAALSLDNARRYTREHTAALALQRDLLPSRLSGGGAVEVASRYLPSDVHDGVGGDWFDAIALPGGRIALVVGDVTGHGINAAATMGRLRTAVRTLAYLDLPPERVLTQLDDLVVRQAKEDDRGGLPSDTAGATCVYAVYDPATRHCTMAVAGHPPPAIVSPGGRVTFPRPPSGTPIGLGLGSYQPFDLELAEGTLIALYTDGLIETRQADIEAGIARLGTALAQAPPQLESLCTTVIHTMLDGRPTEDDITLLVARTRASPSPST